MVGSKIIDREKKGNLWGQLWPGNRLTSVQLCLDHFSCPTQTKGRPWKWGRSLPSKAPTLKHQGSSAWMMSGDLSIPLGGLTFPHLEPLAYMATQASKNMACGSICLLSQHDVPSWLHPWYQLPHMGSYTRVLLSTDLPMEPKCCPIEVPPRQLLARSIQPTRYHWCPPNRDLRNIHPQPSEIMDPGGVEPPDLEEWPEAEQEHARQLLLKWEHLFACSDLGKISLVKHWIELTDWMPFKRHYWLIPPYMYDDVNAQLQEMLDIGAIRKSDSLWSSALVLVQKKDRSLRFCMTSGNLTTGLLRMSICYPALMRPSIVCRDPNASPHLIWTLGTGRSRWMRRASH